MDFMFHIDASGPMDFQAVRKEKTLALVRVLQACAKELGSQQTFPACQHENFKSVWLP